MLPDQLEEVLESEPALQNKNGEVSSQDVHKSYFKLNKHCNLHLVLVLMSAIYLEIL